jgi:PAS domain S-box-containing protein
MHAVSIGLQTDARQVEERCPQHNGLMHVGRSRITSTSRTIAICLLTSFGYFAGAKLGFALTFGPHAVAVMWLPNSILLASMLLTPARLWWLLLLSALPAHVAAEWESGVPLTMILCWFISNSFQALIGAGTTCFFDKGPVRFHSLRSISIFFFFGAFLATLLSSFLDASFVVLNHWGHDNYWEAWRIRFLSNTLTSMALVPAIVTWTIRLRSTKPSISRLAEAGALIGGLLLAGFAAFYWLEPGTENIPSMLYLPLPFLLWAALRFGTRGASTAILVVALLAIWGSTHSHGPFLTGSPEQDCISIQLFFIVMSITLISLAAVLEERKQVGEALSASETQYREVVESQADLVCRYLADSTFTLVNHSGCAIFKRSREALLGHRFVEFLPAATSEKIMRNIASMVASRQTMTWDHEVVLPDGSVRWHHWINHPLVNSAGDVREIQAIGRDITDRKLAESALQQSQERNRAMLDAIPDLIFLVDKSGVYLDYHARDERCLFVPREQLLGRTIHEVLPAKVADDLARSFEVVFRTGRSVIKEYYLDTHGETRCYETRVVQCGVDKILILARDVTEQKRTEAELKQSEERYREVVESQTELVSRYLPDTTLTFVNAACCRFFEKSREELIGRKLLDLLPLDLHETIMSSVASLLASGQATFWEHVSTLSDGSIRWQQWTNYPIHDATGSVKKIQAIGRDITDRKRAEEAIQSLTHASRLAVMGEFTAMIAHEVNQPLSAILSNAEAAEGLLKLESVPLDEIRAILADIHNDDLRAGEAIRRIRALSQRREMEAQALSLNRLVEDVVHLARGDALRRRVRIRSELAPDLPTTRADPIHIQQVLLNLISNGMDAMSRVPVNERILVIQTEKSNGHEAAVAVKDAGPGIPPEMLSRIFDSFFSTKRSGIGLGLSIARSIIEAHCGRIWAENNPGRGATFRFTLPLEGLNGDLCEAQEQPRANRSAC